MHDTHTRTLTGGCRQRWDFFTHNFCIASCGDVLLSAVVLSRCCCCSQIVATQMATLGQAKYEATLKRYAQANGEDGDTNAETGNNRAKTDTTKKEHDNRV